MALAPSTSTYGSLAPSTNSTSPARRSAIPSPSAQFVIRSRTPQVALTKALDVRQQHDGRAGDTRRELEVPRDLDLDSFGEVLQQPL